MAGRLFSTDRIFIENDIQQTSEFRLVNQYESECVTWQNNSLEGISFNFSNSNFGNINIEQTGYATAQCFIQNSLELTSQQILEALELASSESRDGFLPNIGVSLQKVTNTTTQEISTSIENSVMNLCSATQSNIAENITFNISNSNGGNINVIQDGDAVASCVISNLAKINSATEAFASTTANARSSSGGGFIAIMSITIIVVAVVGLVGALISSIFAGECEVYPCDGIESEEGYQQCVAALPYDPKKYCPSIRTAPPPPPPPITVAGVVGIGGAMAANPTDPLAGVAAMGAVASSAATSAASAATIAASTAAYYAPMYTSVSVSGVPVAPVAAAAPPVGNPTGVYQASPVGNPTGVYQASPVNSSNYTYTYGPGGYSMSSSSSMTSSTTY